MKAIQIDAFGNPAEVVKAFDVPDAGAAAAGEVVIALEASSINPADLFVMTGGYSPLRLQISVGRCTRTYRGGNRRIVSKRMQFVEVDQAGNDGSGRTRLGRRKMGKLQGINVTFPCYCHAGCP
jgi:hypothetical protein